MRWIDGPRRDVEAYFSQTPGYPHAGLAGHDWDLLRAEGPATDVTDTEMSGWETAWVDLGGEG
jgi:hypothetical protein